MFDMCRIIRQFGCGQHFDDTVRSHIPYAVFDAVAWEVSIALFIRYAAQKTIFIIENCSRSKTCPQCRRKTPTSSIIRTYFNVANVADTSMAEGSAEQQSKIDNMSYQLLEKAGEIKQKNEQIDKLTRDMAKLKKTQSLSRETILGLEQRLQTNAILMEQNVIQVRC